MRKFFVSIIIGLILIFNSVSIYAAESADPKVFNISQLSLGVIKISYSSEIEKLKVLVEKNNKKYTYDLENDGTLESFPLQMGNGSYKVSVLENISGNQYKYVSTENIDLNVQNQNAVYLASIQNINWNYNMAPIKKAKDLTSGMSTDIEKIKAIYKYVISNMEYDFDKLNNLKSNYLPDITASTKSGKGICYDYASTFAAMLRSVNIPTKLVKGYSVNVNGYHAWNEVYDKNSSTWIVVDPTTDSQLKASKAKFTMIKKKTEYTKVYEF